MVPIASLWLPILLSAAFVWIASAIVWTVLPHHKKDFSGVADEAAARKALGGLAPGQYNIPHVESMAEMKNPAVVAKFTEGPCAFVTVLPSRVPAMGKAMVGSFLFYLVVAGIIAYVTSRTVDPGTEYLRVFQVAGTVAWLAYGFGAIPDAIWFGRPWSSVWKLMGDALLYALLTGGTFGAFWPR